MTKQFWQEVLPIDAYFVTSNGIIPDYDRKIITFLYQPLIGATAVSLYMTLWSQLEENKLSSSKYNHHMLMSIMNNNLKNIYEARLKLEGIGLLKTYINEENDEKTTLYEVQRPLSPEQFFLDGMLNVFLYSKIGKNHYARLKSFFSDNQIELVTKSENITKSFDEVFSSVGFEYSKSRLEEEFVDDGNDSLIGNSEQSQLHLAKSNFDFDLLLATIKNSIVSHKAFTTNVKDAISKLSFVYTIDALQMTNIVLSAVNENDEIDINELRKSARDWYQFENDETLPVLINRVQPPKHRTVKKEPETKEEQLILYLETVSPLQLLTDLSGGATPSAADLKIVEDVMFNQKLLPGVVNVLLQYAMLRTDMKLTKAYIEKIASHWSRKQIMTVEDAMEAAKNEHRQYTEWAKGTKTTLKTTKRTSGRTEKLPEWFDEHKQSQQDNKKQTVKENLDFETERRRLEEMFKK